MDLEITMKMLDATTRVYFADGKYMLLPIDSLTTIAELQDAIVKKLGIKDPSPFAIIETGHSFIESTFNLNSTFELYMCDILSFYLFSYFGSICQRNMGSVRIEFWTPLSG